MNGHATVIEQMIVKVPRGHSLPEGWEFARLIYETTDLYGTWDVMLVQRAGDIDDDEGITPIETEPLLHLRKGDT